MPGPGPAAINAERYESVKPEGDEALVLAMDKLRKKHKR